MMLLCAAVVLSSCCKDDQPTIDVTGVTLDKTTASIVIGTTQTLVATIAPDNVEDKSVTWTSSDATVATVANGVVTAVKEGTTTITATSVANPTKKATCAVTVTKTAVAVTGVTLNKTTLPLVVGSKETLTATVAPADATNKEVTWTTSDAAIATVSATGEVTAIKDGTATITATSVADNTKTATCAITVTKAVVEVAFSGLTANGNVAKTTTTLTLTFDKVIEGLAVEDITLTAGETGIITKGALTPKGGGVYELAVSGITKGGEITVAVAKKGYTITPASNKVKVFITIWADGNLVADGANGAKIGTKTDGGLYFQFGSLVGWSGGATGDGTGTSVDGLALTAKVTPTGYTGSTTTWNNSWTGDPATENTATGTGDPCKYYLKGTWRLPTKDEYVELFKNNDYPTTGPWTWNNDSKSATHTDGLTFPASGFRNDNDGSLGNVGALGAFWSASPNDANNGYLLYFNSSLVYPSFSRNRAYGYPVRCVQASN